MINRLFGGIILLRSVFSLNPIVLKGNLLYDSVTQERFYIKGVTYDPIPECIDPSTDVLADDYPTNEWIYGQEWVNWRSDLEDIARMNVNAIRVYQIDPGKTHTKFMQKAESLGLYVVAPLTGASFGKLDAQLPSPTCYSGDLGKNLLWFSSTVIKQFSEFNNALMFASGNELYLWSNSAHSFPCLKALIRDLHAWQTSCGQTMRRVPLVYAMQDIGSPHREYIGAYLTSIKESEDDALDVFGLNSYVYCDEFWPWNADSPYFKLNEVYKTYSAPFVITEFGCQANGLDARTFSQIPQMMEEFQETVSGGFVYEYSQHLKPWDQTGFGLVETSASTCSSDTDRLWYTNAYALQDKYASELWRNHTNLKGVWTNLNRCTWKPPTTVEHKRPEFPAIGNMDPSVSWAYSNWEDVLPLKPAEDPAVTCPAYSLSDVDLRENFCYGFVVVPMENPSQIPTPVPSYEPLPLPTALPSASPSYLPSYLPSVIPSRQPTSLPESLPTLAPAVDSVETLLPTISKTISQGSVNHSTVADNRESGSSKVNLGSVVLDAEIAVLTIFVVALVVACSFLSRQRKQQRQKLTHGVAAASAVSELVRRRDENKGDASDRSRADDSNIGHVIKNPFHEGTLEDESITVSSTMGANSGKMYQGTELEMHPDSPGPPVGSFFV